MKRTFSDTRNNKYQLEYISSSELWIYYISNRHFITIEKGKKKGEKLLYDCWITKQGQFLFEKRIDKKLIVSGYHMNELLSSLTMILAALKNNTYRF